MSRLIGSVVLTLDAAALLRGEVNDLLSAAIFMVSTPLAVAAILGLFVTGGPKP